MKSVIFLISNLVRLGFSQLAEGSCSGGSWSCEAGPGHSDARHASKNGRWKRMAFTLSLLSTLGL